VKVSRTVWSGGKTEDDFKGLPIAIGKGAYCAEADQYKGE